MTQLIAAKAFRYGGKALAVGDTFDPKTPRDARLLVAVGQARQAEAERHDAEQQEAERREGKRHYKRRDLRAEP